MAEDAPQTIIPLVDDPDTPFLHVDELTAAGPNFGNFILTFSALQMDFAGPGARRYRRPKIRLAIPTPMLERAVIFLQKRLEEAKAASEAAAPGSPPPH